MKDNSQQNNDIHNILHPYIFVLKEGDDINSDLMDYSLLMLNVSPPEILQSPGSERVMHFLPKLKPMTPSAKTDNTNKSPFIEPLL